MTPPSAAPTLSALLPQPGEPPLAADEILSRFVGWAASTGLELYPAQEEAILELLEGKHLVLSTPTGSGKSLVATALHFAALATGETSFYTCPIKALVNEKFFALCQAFGAERVGMITGDASINREAPILCCTAEVLANLALRDPKLRAEQVVMDEFHYYADKERGVAWQVPLLLLEKTRFLLMSATLGDMSAIATSLQEVTGREVARVTSTERPVPLDYEYRETPLHETLEALLSSGRSPVYLVNFSQRAAAEQAQNLMSVNVTSKEEKEALRAALDGFRFDSPYGKELQRFLRHGIGVHHAGLLPKYRLLIEKLAQQGLLKVVSGTDTLGVGVNIPIRTVLFTQLFKYDGEKTAVLSVRDFLQISGRAGRKGFDDRGAVVVQAPEHVIENLKLEQKKQQGKKVVKQKPPEKNYAHWDRATFERMLTRPPEPLESRFQVTHGMLLHLLQAEQQTSARDLPAGGPTTTGYARLVTIIRRSHGNERNRRIHLRTAAAAFRTLRHAGLITLIRGNEYLAPHVKVGEHLQKDFSLNHTLALWLLDTLPRLERASDSYSRDLLTLVEAILENPQAVLWAQQSRLKGEKVAELKAQGMDYEDRMIELDKVEWPKPLREFIYDTFNAFADKHPWVGAENIRPKSVARELFEAGASFNDYVRDYDLQRSEGALLRYLNDVYKTLAQSVPEGVRDEGLDDISAFLRATLRGVDSSLLDEWERLAQAGAMEKPAEAALAALGAISSSVLASGTLGGAAGVLGAGGAAGASGAGGAAAPSSEWAVLLARDPRKLAARVRTELHALLVRLARKDWEGAAALLRNPDAAEPWTPARLEAALAPWFAAHAAIDITPRARRPDRTTLTQTGPRCWDAQQRFGPPAAAARAHAQADLLPDAAEAAESRAEADEADYSLDCAIDLSAARSEDEALLELRSIRL